MSAADRPAPLAPGPALARIRLLCCDVDGVLTDGGLYYDSNGNALMRFHVLDGMGLKRVQSAGVLTCFVSQSATPIISARAKAIGVDQCFIGIENKKQVVCEFAASAGIDLRDICHIADDMNDIGLLEIVGVTVTVPGAVPDVMRICQYVTRAQGGRGAVRELCEAIITSRKIS